MGMHKLGWNYCLQGLAALPSRKVIAKWRLAQGCIEIYDTGSGPHLNLYLVLLLRGKMSVALSVDVKQQLDALVPGWGSV